MNRPDLDPAEFRQLLGRFATGVTVITVHLPDGRPAGMTANSLAVGFARPPLVSVCIDHAAELHDLTARGAGFVVNILEACQEALSRRFADEHLDRFDGVGYHTSARGAACSTARSPRSSARRTPRSPRATTPSSSAGS